MTDNRNDQDDRETGGRRGGNAQDVRQKAIEAYDSARQSVAGVGRRAESALDEAPLIALAGGLAAGALIAALLPRTESEEKLFRPVGDRVKGTARAAAAAAKDAGTARLEELGLTRDRGVEALRSVLEGAGEAARTSAQAALSAARTRE